MKRAIKRPEDIRNILGKVLGKIQKRDPYKKEKILNAWKKVVGERAARHSRPVSTRRKVLTIEIDSSTWLYELNLKKPEILKDITRELHGYKIEGIRFRMGEIT